MSNGAPEHTGDHVSFYEGSPLQVEANDAKYWATKSQEYADAAQASAAAADASARDAQASAEEAAKYKFDQSLNYTMTGRWNFDRTLAVSDTLIRVTANGQDGFVFHADLGNYAEIRPRQAGTTKTARYLRYRFSDEQWVFNTKVNGLDPTEPAHLATKSYVDAIALNPGQYGYNTLVAANSLGVSSIGYDTIHEAYGTFDPQDTGPTGWGDYTEAVAMLRCDAGADVIYLQIANIGPDGDAGFQNKRMVVKDVDGGVVYDLYMNPPEALVSYQGSDRWQWAWTNKTGNTKLVDGQTYYVQFEGNFNPTFDYSIIGAWEFENPVTHRYTATASPVIGATWTDIAGNSGVVLRHLGALDGFEFVPWNTGIQQNDHTLKYQFGTGLWTWIGDNFSLTGIVDVAGPLYAQSLDARTVTASDGANFLKAADPTAASAGYKLRDDNGVCKLENDALTVPALWFDQSLATITGKSDWTFENNVSVPLAPTLDTHAASKLYVDNSASSGIDPAANYSLTGLWDWTAQAITDTPLTVKGAVGQTGELMRFTDSSGSNVATVAADGQWEAVGSVRIGPKDSSAVFFRVTNDTRASSRNAIITRDWDSNNLFALRNTTAHATEFRVGKVAQSLVTAFTLVPGPTPDMLMNATQTFGSVQQYAQGTFMVNEAQATTAVPLVCRGASGQTATLQRWQNDAQTDLAYVDNVGKFFMNANLQVATAVNIVHTGGAASLNIDANAEGGTRQVTYFTNNGANLVRFLMNPGVGAASTFDMQSNNGSGWATRIRFVGAAASNAERLVFPQAFQVAGSAQALIDPGLITAGGDIDIVDARLNVIRDATATQRVMTRMAGLPDSATAMDFLFELGAAPPFFKLRPRKGGSSLTAREFGFDYNSEEWFFETAIRVDNATGMILSPTGTARGTLQYNHQAAVKWELEKTDAGQFVMRRYVTGGTSPADIMACNAGNNDVTFVGNVTALSFTPAPSFRALKENFSDITNVGSIIDALLPQRYNLKADESKRVEVGLVLEDVEPVLPELVRINDETGAGGIDYARLSVVLLAEIKQLRDRVAALEAA